LLTGAIEGIGLATARRLAPWVGHLILHGPLREEDVSEVTRDIARRMRKGTRLTYLEADFDELAQVSALATNTIAAADQLDILINNAGKAGPPRRAVSRDGNETTLQTNYLSLYLLTTLLRPLLEAGTRRSRVVNVSSATHFSASLELDDLNLEQHGYSPVRAYAQSKLATVTYTCALAKQLDADSLEAVSLHPGVIATRLLEALFNAHGDPPDHAAENILYVAGSAENVNGLYFDEKRPVCPNPIALDARTQEALLARSSELVSAAMQPA
jgi:NAD(P)-dependent dehydrogenase (short-subunit alcohol dehydrogenase family)